jgi:hypothetical protein
MARQGRQPLAVAPEAQPQSQARWTGRGGAPLVFAADTARGEVTARSIELRARAAASIWVKTYGERAPEQIRRWAANPTTDAAAAAFLGEVARLAELMLTGGLAGLG